ncbi:MAG: hypothetical protein WDZ45_02675 [Flavobacteriaceae bacterium]
MKNSNRLLSVLLIVIVIQSVFIFSSFSENEKEEEVVQSYQIERKYAHGKYFYVLVSGGEAKGFMRE